jgi:hypothetical protein
MEIKFEIACYDNNGNCVGTSIHNDMKSLFRDLDMLLAMREHSKFEISKVEIDGETGECVDCDIIADINLHLYPDNF